MTWFFMKFYFFQTCHLACYDDVELKTAMLFLAVSFSLVVHVLLVTGHILFPCRALLLLLSAMSASH